jgi:hypothetical protein
MELTKQQQWIAYSNRMRNTRFRMFQNLAESLPRPLRIIDIGGTADFWERRGWAGRGDVKIITVNIAPETRRYENIEPVVGDAANLASFADQSFDIAFSNSVIEHLFTYEKQAAMAREVRRVGRAFYVQTPNFWFPFEPHFRVPGWQWMPLWLRIAIIRRRSCGFRGRCRDPQQARELVSEVRLLSRRELRKLFPGATVAPERFGGLVKSWMVYHGFP